MGSLLVEIIAVKTCGNCANGHFVPQDVTKRTCRGAPPQVVPIPQRGAMQLIMMYPTVEAKDAGCGMHKTRLDLSPVPGLKEDSGNPAA